jgi:carboxyl-terminal processing protease
MFKTRLMSRQLGTAVCRFLLSLVLVLLPLSALRAELTYTAAQSETARELVQTLEKRHYSRLEYDAVMASAHLDNYIDRLDPGRMYLLASDVAEFQSLKTAHDKAFSGGQLDAGFIVFDRYHKRLTARLQQLIDNLEAEVENFDFGVEEYLPLTKRKELDWARTSLELDDRWRKQVKNQVLSLRLSEKPEDEIVDLLRKRYKNQLRRSEQFNAQDVFQLYANALSELYDPHTSYLSPRNFEVFNMNMSLKLEGIGAVLQAEDEYTRIVRLVPGGPADKHGDLSPSDRIVAVGQGSEGEMQDVIGWRLDDVTDLIKGPKGSTVRLEIVGSDAMSSDRRREIAIVRDEVKLEEQSAQKSILEIPDGDEIRRVGVIDVPAFYIDFEAMRRGDPNYRSTTRDVRKLLEELEAEQIDGLVVDLRNNGGGSLQEANELTGLFIEQGPTVQIRHSSRRVFRDGKRDRSSHYEGALVVLINRLSASASEIFAGAIQDYGRGLVVGEQSFGKGTVQTLIPLPEGQIKVTESKFYRISGESTQHRGVVPDIAFPPLLDASEIGESALDHALPWDQINPVNFRRYSDYRSLVPELGKLFQGRSSSDPDLTYLQEQAALAKQSREVRQLPLREVDRIAMREQQRSEQRAIENRRREAKGLTPLSDEEKVAAAEDEESGLVGAEGEMAAALREDEVELSDDTDILLLEAGRVLLDALSLNERRLAHQSAAVARP